ncbi:Synaptic glycoprotein SC2 [Giardia lamblia P15]|uniref:Synaptic glycoprotein SC2 n=1 Tax=Giardia intestinalis (strain P15) TaxID=658858 RepID=E1F0P5_GIAIA|nr:Synaptic glycoprotein SC2 [Giardia lamblia P15]
MKISLLCSGATKEFEFPTNIESSKFHLDLCQKMGLKASRTRFFCVPKGSSSDATTDESQKSGRATRHRKIYIDPESTTKLLSDYLEEEPRESTILQLGIKDIGPQFSYRGVFLLEYIGPLVIWVVVAMNTKMKTSFTNLATVMWVFHYVKRLFETLFVHTFSNKTMPLRNLIKNCIYYWGFASAISWTILQSNVRINMSIREKVGEWEDLLHAFQDTKDYTHILQLSKSISNHLLYEVTIMPAALFFVSELSNLYCHLKLRYLRPPGSREHFLPRGLLFDRITCPNYTTEILSWMFFAMFTRSWVCAVFNVCGAVQMYIWARQKRARLAHQFPEVRKRFCIFPFL